MPSATCETRRRGDAGIIRVERNTVALFSTRKTSRRLDDFAIPRRNENWP